MMTDSEKINITNVDSTKLNSFMTNIITRADQENSVRVYPATFFLILFFLTSAYFTEDRTNLPPKRFQLLLEGVHTSFSKETFSNLCFSREGGGGLDPLPLLWIRPWYNNPSLLFDCIGMACYSIILMLLVESQVDAYVDLHPRWMQSHVMPKLLIIQWFL